MLYFKQKEIDAVVAFDLLAQIKVRVVNEVDFKFIKNIQFFFIFSNVLDFDTEELYEYVMFLYLLTGRMPLIKKVVSRLHRGKRYYSVKLVSEIVNLDEILQKFFFLRYFILYSDLCDLVVNSKNQIIVKTVDIHNILRGFRVSSSFYTKQLFKSLYISLNVTDKTIID
jgi:hypothetical protein